jgi:hypothetical protein
MRHDPKESPNPTTFSNMRSQNYLSSASQCHSYITGNESDFYNSCNNSAIKVKPLLINAPAISDFKSTLMNGGMSCFSTKIGTFAQQ